MPLPYLLIVIFITAQLVFAILIGDLFVYLRRLLRALDRHDVYTVRQDINKARLGTELHEKLDTILKDVAINDDSIFRLREAIHQESLLTRERIAQTKTRLADEERTDQAARRKARAKKAKP